MKRHVIILLGIAVSLFLCRSAAAQEVVVDPTHIGVAVENTASSLEEMITMIEEMFSLNGKLDDLYGLAEKAGEVADRFREVGYLVDMTDSYNDLLKRTYEYSAKVKSWAAEGDLYGYERQLRYFHSCEMQGIKLFNQYVEYFRNLKTSDADKAEQAQKALKELDKRRIAVTREMASIEQSRRIAAGIADAMNHTMEQYFAADTTLLNDGFCESMMRSLMINGRKCLENPEDYNARAEMMLDCTYGCNGILSLGNSQSGWPCHAIEHALSAYYDITHGEGLAIITPRWMRHILSEKTIDRFVKYGINVFGIDASLPKQEIAQKAIDATYKFFESINIPMHLRDVGIDDSRIDEMAHHVAVNEGLDKAYVPLTEQDIREILVASL